MKRILAMFTILLTFLTLANAVFTCGVAQQAWIESGCCDATLADDLSSTALTIISNSVPSSFTGTTCSSLRTIYTEHKCCATTDSFEFP